MRLFRAVVEDNNDPLKQNRVRVRIFGIHTNKNENSGEEFNFIRTSDLPWSEVMGGNQFGLISGVGLSSVLRKGTWVWIVLNDDNPNKPIIIGTIIGNNTKKPSYANGEGFSDPDGVYPKSARLGKTDINPKTQGKYQTLATLETESGHTIELDDTPGDRRIKVTHASGTSFLIDDAGNMTFTVVGNLVYNIDGTTTINSTGNYSVTAPRIDLN